MVTVSETSYLVSQGFKIVEMDINYLDVFFNSLYINMYSKYFREKVLISTLVFCTPFKSIRFAYR